MAPKTNSEEKLQNQKCRLVHFQSNRNHSSCNGPASKSQAEKRRDAVSRSATDVKPPQNYENLLLFYLTKLKNLFSNNHPEPAARENSAMRMNKLHHNHYLRSAHRASSVAHPCRYTSSNPPKPREDPVQSNVYKVVSAALEYGFANDVLERKGDYFCLKNRRSRLAARQPTPGPRYCERCCNVHQHIKRRSEDCFSNRFSDRNKQLSSYCERPLRTIEQGKIDRHYRERSNSMCYHRHHRPIERSLGKPVDTHHCNLKMKGHCPGCRVLQRERK